jgi:hypothetical protein
MWLAYVIALLPVVAGAILWTKREEVHLLEWIGAGAIGFVVAGIFHAIAIFGMTTDEETWSGKVIKAIHHPWWHASWWETQTYSCGTAKQPRTCTRRVHRTRTYPEHWTVSVSYGEKSETYEISQERFRQICEKFGVDKPVAVRGSRLHMDAGDANDYHANNHTGAVIPAHETYRFENRVKAAPSLFSYPSVPEDVGFPYPESKDWSLSNRLLGTAKKDFSIEQWDILNAELGPSKWINLIAVGFGDKSSEAAHTLEAKWIGGKKNDLVICYGDAAEGGKPAWVYVFGWTEENIVKQNLQTLFLLNKPGDDLLPQIKTEILANYKMKDWTKFDYITVTPPTWAFIVLIIIQVAAMAGFWWWALNNDYDKEAPYRRRPRAFGYRRRMNLNLV